MSRANPRPRSGEFSKAVIVIVMNRLLLASHRDDARTRRKPTSFRPYFSCANVRSERPLSGQWPAPRNGRRRSSCLVEGKPILLLALKERPFSTYTPAIARDRAIL